MARKKKRPMEILF
jgi:hypothetical protein